jgi:predicted  nucleic acid-binding Zn-ribbon protein
MNDFAEELDRLVRLQRIDSLLEQAARVEKEFPEKIGEIDAEFAKQREHAAKERAKLEALQKQRREKERELDPKLEKIKKSEEKLLTVKTNEEYQAALREIDHAKKQNAKIEEEILVLMEETEGMDKALAARESQLKEDEKACQEEKAKLEEQREEYKREVVKQARDREDLLLQIDPALVKQYETIRRKRYGLAVVSVRDECCSGCNKTIPPQVLNEVLTGDRLMICPLCGRILFWEKNHAAAC